MTASASLGLALNNAVSGLRVNQQSLAVLSQNISNVNTDGYSRQVVQQSANYVEGIGSGVKIDDIVRKVDKYLQRSVQSQGSTNATAQTVSDYYSRLQSLIGQPGAQNSVDAYITTFFNSLQALTATPDTPSLRSNAINTANTLAQNISGTANHIEDLRFQADRDISDLVSSTNQTIDQLTALNDTIAKAKGLGNPTAGLLDERDRLLRSLASNLDVNVTYNESGGVNVVTGSGISLVEGGIRHQLRYDPAQSVDTLTSDGTLNALTVVTYDASGKQTGTPQVLITAGASSAVSSRISSGKLAGLQQIRDTVLPQVLDQLDQLASRLRDNVNKVQNSGSGFPPATSLTGQRLTDPSTPINWTGAIRLAVVKPDGSPAQAGYADENYTGKRPLLLTLSTLDSGFGQGTPTTQSIIDEINNHFAAPSPKVELGNLNNIQLASNTSLLPSGAPSLFTFDLDAENISAYNAPTFVTGITVKDSGGTNITSVTQGPPSVTLSTTNTYTSTAGLSTVDVALATLPTGLSVGDTIYLGAPSVPGVNGIPAANLTGYFKVTAIAGTTVTVDSGVIAGPGGPVSDATPATAYGAYATIGAGAQQRTTANGKLQVDLSGNIATPYYDVTLDVGTVDQNGVAQTSQITYRVFNNAQNLLNDRYSATAATGSGTIVPPQTTQDTLRAIMVDKDGNELPKVNGIYGNTQGYLKLIATNGNSVVIDSLDSQQLGLSTVPSDTGTGYGFSHYYGLNNFFESNAETLTGETVHNSAIKLKVQQRLLDNSNLLSTGALVLQNQPPAGSTLKPQYTYVRYAGDNTTVQALANLGTDAVSFDAAGGLPSSSISLTSYTGQLLGHISSQSTAATATAATAQSLYDGFKSRSDAVSGVNLDEELANTITYQNAYSATARIVTVVNAMYDSLLQAIG